MTEIIVLRAAALAVMSLASYFDLKHRKIPNACVLALAALAVVHMTIIGSYALHIAGLMFPAAALLLLRKNSWGHIGFGDIKLTMALGLFYGCLCTGVIAMAALLMALSLSLLRQRFSEQPNDVPFAPLLTLSSLIGLFPQWL